MRLRQLFGRKGSQCAVRKNRTGASRHWRPAVESLEARTVLSLAFSFSLSDPNGVVPQADQAKFFNSLRWGGYWATEGFYGRGTIDVQVNILNSLGTDVLATGIGPDRVYSDGPTTDIHERLSQYEARTGIDANGVLPDMVIEVNETYLTGRYQNDGQPTPGKFWLDPNYHLPGPDPEPPSYLPATQIDFATVISHEVLHGLGFASSYGANPSSPNKSRYDQYTSVSGGNAWFNGPLATAANGGNPVALDSPADLSHVLDPGDLMSADIGPGERIFPSAIDRGVLRDMGWTTGKVRFNVATSMVSENSGSIQLTVTRLDGTYPGQIRYAFGGTAVPGADYGTSGGSTIYFAAGQLAQTISIPIYDNSYVDAPRYFDVALFADDFSTLVPDTEGNTQSRVTIVSNEKRPGNTVPDDFDNDGKSDFSVFGQNLWGTYGFSTLLSSQGFDTSHPIFFAMGNTLSAIPTVADYDGDGRADYSIYSPNSAGVYTWTWYSSMTGAQGSVSGFGSVDAVPVTGDFDGDGKSDFSVFGASNGIYGFYTLVSSLNFNINQQSGFNYNGAGFGFAQSQPLAGDFDGDGKDDYSLYTPNGLGGYSWFWISSLNGLQGGVNNFGSANFKPVVGDFDGDGKSDFSVYGSANGVYGFYTLLSSVNFDINQQSSFNFGGVGYGWSDAVPTVADYDGDGRSDYSLFSPVAEYGSSNWTYIASTNTTQYGYAFGTVDSRPIAAPFITRFRKARGII